MTLARRSRDRGESLERSREGEKKKKKEESEMGSRKSGRSLANSGRQPRKESECQSPSSMVRHQMNRILPTGRQNPDTASHKANTKPSESAQKIPFFFLSFVIIT